MQLNQKWIILSVSLIMLMPWMTGQQRRRGSVFDQEPSNLTVLKVNSGRELRPIMRSFDEALGVGCAFCHESPDFEKDNAMKDRAREMIQMVEDLNSRVFTWPGAPEATCFMCHGGSESPEFHPPPESQ